MNIFKRTLAALLALGLLAPCALADGLSLSGTVAASRTVQVWAPIGGTVASVDAEAGQSVKVGDPIATLATEKVYASESGTITGVFIQPGDDVETVSNRYGAAMYIEGEAVYTIDASTENAYNATANRFVHVGESVHLRCYSDADHSGDGVITAIEGTSFTVDVTSGAFLVGETVSVFRGSATAANRIGRGTLSRKSPTAVTGQGSVVSVAVRDGDEVQRGDLLFETLSGGFDGLYMSGNQILAPEDGVIAQLNLQQGSPVEKGAVAAVLYPSDAMCIEAEVYEGDLALIGEGDPVDIELIWNQDSEVRYSGTVARISALATSAASAAEGGGGSAGGDAASVETSYTATIAFTPDAQTRYGMTAVEMTHEEEDEDLDEEEELDEEPEEEPDEELGEAPEASGEPPEDASGGARGGKDGERRGRPQDFPGAEEVETDE